MDKRIHGLYGLKFNPFAPDVPTEALFVDARTEIFCQRVRQLTADGGFALVTGDPGTGKSAILRILTRELGQMRDVSVGMISRPQASIPDFYREIGEHFTVDLKPHNRWAGSKALRDKWKNHIMGTLSRPVLIIDEAQELKSPVLSELRLLASSNLDSYNLLTIVLAGDISLIDRLRTEFIPLDSRIRVRLQLERRDPEDLSLCLKTLLEQAGAPQLMTPEVINTIADHAMGNLRSLMIMADNLLSAAVRREVRTIDEKLFFEVCTEATTKKAQRRR